MRLIFLLFIFTQLLFTPTMLTAFGIDYNAQNSLITEEENSSQNSQSKEENLDVVMHFNVSHEFTFQDELNAVFAISLLFYEKKIYISVLSPPPEFV